ncbi:MBL fold metallo-hydrolase [Tumebacillus permanentifrigoris]|uniref:Glyoxylase-like metal-dependent hydrolase (Beta-lactamase superfamily II) n=1 Tax=Tumebacillus permanentifrigoris TaxID=378543 RepID=A0A316D6J1_9BACL|nr:MBL fold metallo-hydrolase [Tumebacillus permanentifrigoris]PWK09597.1 glyoxylase-like metal-dependent hydrolase (beta-lactamase superfamily II) [Tumebacillus permanentifrigoris]
MQLVEQISPHVWILPAEHKSDRPILAAIVGSRRTLLMDAGNSPAHARLFQEQLQARGVRLPDLLVLTHWHWDHSFGMSEWNLPAVAHQQTVDALRKLVGLDWSALESTLQALTRQGMASAETLQHMQEEYGADRNIQVVVPDLIFAHSLHFDLGDVTCEIRHVGGDHTSDSCFLYVKEDKVLFLGDSLGPSVYGGPRTYTANHFLRLLESIYEYDADLIVESHGQPLALTAFREDLNEWEQLARLVEQFGRDRERIVAGLQGLTQVHDLTQAVDWYMAGLEKKPRNL